MVGGVQWWWVVVGGGGWWWIVVGEGGWWWMVVGGGGWWRVVVEIAEKNLFQSLFLNKVASLRPATLFKKKLWNRFFSAIFAKLLGTFFYRTPPRDCF